MTPIEITLLATLMFGLSLTGILAYQAYKDLTELRTWWWDYQQRMTELNQRLQDRVPLEQLLKQRSESGEVSKSNCNDAC